MRVKEANMDNAKQSALDAWRDAIRHVADLGYGEMGLTYVAWAFARAQEFMQQRKAENDSESLSYIHHLAENA